MDEHNVHHLWGVSPAVDLLSLVPPEAMASSSDEPLRILQVRAPSGLASSGGMWARARA
jgi:hypothetical protein